MEMTLQNTALTNHELSGLFGKEFEFPKVRKFTQDYFKKSVNCYALSSLEKFKQYTSACREGYIHLPLVIRGGRMTL